MCFCAEARCPISFPKRPGDLVGETCTIHRLGSGSAERTTSNLSSDLVHTMHHPQSLQFSNSEDCHPALMSPVLRLLINETPFGCSYSASGGAIASKQQFCERFMFFMPNVQSEPRAWLAHFVLLGARNVTAMLVGSTALLGSVFLRITCECRITIRAFDNQFLSYAWDSNHLFAN